MTRLTTWPGAAAILTLLAASLAVGPASADEHIYSYEPSSDAARALAQTGLSFEFERRGFGGVRIHRIVQTGERGAADVKPVSEGELGAGGLKAALGREAPAGGLYAIEPEGDGQAFIDAVCPGAEKAWLVVSMLKRFRDLTIQAVGRDQGALASHKCVTLSFTFYNEWTLPPDRAAPRPRFTRNLP